MTDSLHVTTRPQEVFEVEQKVFVEIDPSQITLVN
jgi:hypothetical protein